MIKNLVAPSTTYKVISLFAGAGGSALGLENAGFQHVMLNDLDKQAVATLRQNKVNWHVIQGDVREINFKNYLGQIDVIEAGFPCQSFSYAGKQLGLEDVRGTLFYEFVRAIKEAQPKIIIGENVKGLVKHNNGLTLNLMLNTLKALNYSVSFKVLKAQCYDVPQKRERLIIVGTRKDLGMPIMFPKEKSYIISLRDAIGDCPKSLGYQYPIKKQQVLSLVPPGGCWRDLPERLQKEYMMKSYNSGGGKTGMARRLSWNEPSLTLTCHPAQKQTERCHPDETRPLNIREYARIQTFPDSWQFSGSIAAQYKQIGNAIPINLAYHLGTAAVAMLDGNLDDSLFSIHSPL